MSFTGVRMCGSLKLVLVFVIGVYCNSLCQGTRLVVNLPDGSIEGHALKSGNGKEYFAFQEIPYAAPPVGNNRFKEPLPPIPWMNTLKTVKNKKVCVQSNATAITPIPGDMVVTEDCLYLNVYTPTKPGSELLLPVLFLIHGGGFFYGSGALQYYDPKYFMDYDIIIVSMNYRLGPFGFLTTNDENLPGNLGLKDQLQALKWTYQNIHLFGGDKHKITVMGESAGSTSAGYMQLSPLTEGLVAGYILQSGSPISPYAYQDNAKHYAFKMAKVLNGTFESNDSKDLLTFLKSKTADEIQNAIITNDGYAINPIAALVIWLPIIEKPTKLNAVISEPMQEALIAGNYNKVPLMTGMTSEESLFFLKFLTPDQLLYFQSQLDANIHLIINPRLNVSPANLTKAAAEYKAVYTSTTFLDNPAAYAKYIGEEVFATPNIRHAELVSHRNPSVYLYEFAYKGQMGGLMDLPRIPGTNTVGHTEELHYMFGGAEGLKDNFKLYPREDQLTMKRMLKLWTNFIKYQNPTPVKDELFENVIWPNMYCGELSYLSINNTLQPSVNPKYYKEVKQVFEKYIAQPYIVF